MDRKKIIEGLRELAIGERLTFENQADVCSAAIAELESIDLTPEQRAERRLRAAYPGASEVRVIRASAEYYVATVESGCCGRVDWLNLVANGATPDKAVDRLLARVK